MVYVLHNEIIVQNKKPWKRHPITLSRTKFLVSAIRMNQNGYRCCGISYWQADLPDFATRNLKVRMNAVTGAYHNRYRASYSYIPCVTRCHYTLARTFTKGWPDSGTIEHRSTCTPVYRHQKGAFSRHAIRTASSSRNAFIFCVFRFLFFFSDSV